MRGMEATLLAVSSVLLLSLVPLADELDRTGDRSLPIGYVLLGTGSMLELLDDRVGVVLAAPGGLFEGGARHPAPDNGLLGGATAGLRHRPRQQANHAPVSAEPVCRSVLSQRSKDAALS